MLIEDIVDALGGRSYWGYSMARCPAHDDRTPSLSIREGEDGSIWFHCFAGCPQEKVIDHLCAMGFWQLDKSKHKSRLDGTQVKKTPGAQQAATDQALAIWRESRPAAASPVERYLASRGIHVPVPNSLRFHPRLWCREERSNRPAMVALVSDYSGKPMAIHRTYLKDDGSGKAPIQKPKLMFGPCAGNAVWLASPMDELMLGEGIETCLSVMQATGKPAWAALSASGLRKIMLPSQVCRVIVLADGDDAGEAAAQDCARRLLHEGRCVHIARPPRGMDFNDILLGRISSIGDIQ